jgi:hypothetical protein
MIDPTLALALNVQSAPGTMAVLIGSGVSRSAGIPTGWEVVLDLIRKLARMEGESCEPDPTVWYHDKHGIEPDYATLLDSLCSTAAARQSLLRTYFEPNDQEREEGLKMPTAAHRAIATLIRLGFVKVVVTPNFDRLLERAIQDEGIAPTVIATADGVEGSIPLAHAGCVIVKVHGDYLDSRIRNTPLELATYDPRVASLLDRVFDEYGMVVCGWSADYDTALRAAIERRRTKRYPWYWATRSSPSANAAALIASTSATTVSIRDANTFFSAVTEKVQALADLAGRVPVSAKVAQATLKRILLEPTQQTRVHDLIGGQADQVVSALKSSSLADTNAPLNADEILRRLALIEAAVGPLIPLFATAAHWGVTSPAVWHTTFQRLISAVEGPRGGFAAWINLRRYAASLVLYAVGLGGLAGSDLKLFARLGQTVVEMVSVDGRQGPASIDLFSAAVIHTDLTNRLPNPERVKYVASSHIERCLREPLREFLPEDEIYVRAFDRLEYLFSLLFADNFREATWSPLGSYVWRSCGGRFNVMQDADEQASQTVPIWPPLQAGLFGGSLDTYKQASLRMRNYLSTVSRW